MSERIIDKRLWEALPDDEKINGIDSKPSKPYWLEVWHIFRKNGLAMLGLQMTCFVVLFACVGPLVTKHDYSTQQLAFANVPPRFEIYKVSEESFIYMHNDYKLFDVTRDGQLNHLLSEDTHNIVERTKTYEMEGKTIILDYAYAALKAEQNPEGVKFKIRVDGAIISPYAKVHNRLNILGTDGLGRDLLARLIYGAQISLVIAIVATLVNFIVGVLYGGIAGYFGGRVDNIMMRMVDTISTIPLILYVILLSVIIGTVQKAIIIAIGSVYWVNMARIVRGQILSLKEQDFILSARTIGSSPTRILLRHLIPNAIGPIIVALTMMIPSAIFTEAFLSFIGLGVRAPLASWGTLASDALGGLRSYPYQLFYPSLGISITVLALNFLGDGLRDALDPKLR
ncbi:MAG TPA: ABC transporter permease [Clostridiales bacterium UBA8960]|nr:ABC transporter permease [Clostridiales bacterium UBA8960]